MDSQGRTAATLALVIIIAVVTASSVGTTTRIDRIGSGVAGSLSARVTGSRTSPEANGDGWQRDATPPDFPSLYYPSMASDPVTNAAILFGGCTDVLCTSWSDATWSYSSGSWTQLHPPASPGARGEAGMAWDPALDAVVLFGGRG